jgi:Ca2+/Na+ antiporter
MAVIVDDYFVASLEKLSNCLNLSKDVAGATLMAAAGSAPELFSSIIGTFLTKGDIGVGTIVGSGVFNILVLVGVCCLVAKSETSITSWTLIRDNVYYLFSIGVLLVVLHGEDITWYKSLCLVVLYGIYIVIMKFNESLQRYYGRLLEYWCSSTREQLPCYRDGSTEVIKDHLASSSEEKLPILHASKSFSSSSSSMDRQKSPLDRISYGSFTSSGVWSDKRKHARCTVCICKHLCAYNRL